MARMDAETFEELATVLGAHAAGEVLLLAVARVCGDNAGLWNKSHSIGIPWQRKKWTALSTLKKQYNDGVESALPALEESEKTGSGEDNADMWEWYGGADGVSSARSIIPYAPRAELDTAPAPKRRLDDDQ